ncbi:hypothetical protein NPIL_43021 [Nephila pilipes]|uniref:Uncharacterized protein n=1 Tax=Nephila pilipes TaxID=299642 RepID=A0A8X6UHP0_NEPPI|nr:hypothetical protein NPIL_43021 [Nephila pilipes]
MMLSMSDTVAVPTDSMDTGQTEIDTIQMKCNRISLLKKKLECDEARQTYLKSLIIIEEREKNFSQQPLWTSLDMERKTLEVQMKNIAARNAKPPTTLAVLSEAFPAKPPPAVESATGTNAASVGASLSAFNAPPCRDLLSLVNGFIKISNSDKTRLEKLNEVMALLGEA